MDGVGWLTQVVIDGAFIHGVLLYDLLDVFQDSSIHLRDSQSNVLGDGFLDAAQLQLENAHRDAVGDTLLHEIQISTKIATFLCDHHVIIGGFINTN